MENLLWMKNLLSKDDISAHYNQKIRSEKMKNPFGKKYNPLGKNEKSASAKIYNPVGKNGKTAQ
jgi:hypothetical protein